MTRQPVRSSTSYATGGSRDFSSISDTRADHYEVQVDDAHASEAQRVLAMMPAV